MSPEEIRSDLIGAWILYSWLVKNMPHRAEGWQLEVNEYTKSFAERIRVLFPPIELIFLGQAAIARTAIERWQLVDVAYLGSGTPTPFSPKPNQLLYYTDANLSVLAEAERAGYRTRLVDIRNFTDLKKLDGCKTTIATGLIHFLPDEVARAVFTLLAQAGFNYLIFNNMITITASDVNAKDQWGNLGFKLFPRSESQVKSLLEGLWDISEVAPITEFFPDNEEIMPLFRRGQNFYNVYFVKSTLA
jgi:hypothetical protein